MSEKKRGFFSRQMDHIGGNLEIWHCMHVAVEIAVCGVAGGSDTSIECSCLLSFVCMASNMHLLEAVGLILRGWIA